jgi:hypothetical protein
MIPFINLIMVDDTIYKSLIMDYQSLKYNFILKNMLKTAFGLSEWNRLINRLNDKSAKTVLIF